MDDVDAQLAELAAEFVADIRRIVGRPRGCLDEGDAEVEAIVRASLDGLGIAADQSAVETAEEMGTLEPEWTP